MSPGDLRGRSPSRSPSPAADRHLGPNPNRRGQQRAPSAERRSRRDGAKKSKKSKKRRRAPARSESCSPPRGRARAAHPGPGPTSSRSPSRTPSRSRSRSRSRNRGRRRGRSPSPLALRLKALSYIARGGARRLRRLLRRHGRRLDVAAADSQRRTLLHQACACGNEGAVAALLSHGAPAAVVDAAGDAPAHLAARGGHLEALAEVMQAPDAPSLDFCGSDGLPLKQAMARALGGALARAGGGAGGGAALRLQGPSALGAAGGGGRLAGWAEGESEEDEEEAQWRRRLRDECSDGEGGGWGGGGGGGGDEEGGWSGWTDGAAARWAEAETEDAWADRLWAQMQRRRSAAAAASSAAFAAGLRAEAARKAAEAAERSTRILQEEQAKDSQWRRRTLAIQAAPAGPEPLDLAAVRAAYDERWARLDAQQAAAAAAAAPPPPLRYHDIPWPLEPPPPPSTAGPAAGPYDNRLAVVIGPPPPPPPPPPLTADALRDFLLLGAAGPADVRRRLRAELLRWHPDKFGARFGTRLAAAGGGERERALARVAALAQVLTQVLTQVLSG